MPVVTFTGQSAATDVPSANTSRLLNLFRQPVEQGGRTRFVMRAVAGMEPYADFDRVFMRDMMEIGGALIVACGGKLFRVRDDITDLGDINSSPKTSISSNTGHITVAAGGAYYVWDGKEMTEPTVDFAVGGVEYLGGYTILTEEGGRRFAWSSLTDPKIFPALNFATAETTDDDLIRPVVINGMLWLFKERSAEVWYVDDTSASEAGAFGKMPGGDKEIGLRSFGLITKLPGGAFFVGGDGKAYTLTAGQLQNVGTPGVETAIERSDPDRCFYYEWRGHKFCVIRFRNAPAWVYDLATGEWHERSEGWPVGRWSGVATAKWRGRWMIGSDTGMVSVLHGVVDNLQPLHRIAVSTPVYSDGARSILSEMEFFAHQGLYDTIRERAGLVYAADALFAEDALYAMAEAARNPKLALRLSRDGGMIFGREREEMFGATGRYDKRVVFRALGQFRQMVAEIHMSDPVDIPIFSDARVKFA